MSNHVSCCVIFLLFRMACFDVLMIVCSGPIYFLILKLRFVFIASGIEDERTRGGNNVKEEGGNRVVSARKPVGGNDEIAAPVVRVGSTNGVKQDRVAGKKEGIVGQSFTVEGEGEGGTGSCVELMYGRGNEKGASDTRGYGGEEEEEEDGERQAWAEERTVGEVRGVLLLYVGQSELTENV